MKVQVANMWIEAMPGAPISIALSQAEVDYIRSQPTLAGDALLVLTGHHPLDDVLVPGTPPEAGETPPAPSTPPTPAKRASGPEKGGKSKPQRASTRTPRKANS